MQFACSTLYCFLWPAPHCVINGKNYGNVLRNKSVLSFPIRFLCEIFCIVSRTEWEVIKMCCVWVRYRYCCVVCLKYLYCCVLCLKYRYCFVVCVKYRYCCVVCVNYRYSCGVCVKYRYFFVVCTVLVLCCVCTVPKLLWCVCTLIFCFGAAEDIVCLSLF